MGNQVKLDFFICIQNYKSWLVKIRMFWKNHKLPKITNLYDEMTLIEG